MFVYFHCSKTGSQHVQAFHKADKAAEYVINQIEALAIDEGRNLGLAAAKKKARGAFVGGDLNADNLNNIFMDQQAQAAAPVPPGIGFFDDIQPVAGQHAVTKKDTTVEKKVPVELLKLRDHMELAKKDKSFENAVKAIELYEDFLKYALNSESSIHTLTDLKIVE